MKKAISLLLALVLCLSLCACGGGNGDTPDIPETTESPTETTAPEVTVLTKEEMLEQATEVQAHEIDNTSHENLALAKQNYCNTVLKVTGQIARIAEDHIELGTGWYVVDVYLPIDELVTLQANQQVTIVGQTTESIEKDSNGMSHYQMPTAYFVTDRFDIRCVVQTAGIKLINAEGKQLDGIRTVHWAEGVDKSQYTWQEVTISAKCIYNSMTAKWEYHDASIVE